jgi:hypothetical protein
MLRDGDIISILKDSKEVEAGEKNFGSLSPLALYSLLFLTAAPAVSLAPSDLPLPVLWK